MTEQELINFGFKECPVNKFDLESPAKNFKFSVVGDNGLSNFTVYVKMYSPTENHYTNPGLKEIMGQTGWSSICYFTSNYNVAFHVNRSCFGCSPDEIVSWYAIIYQKMNCNPEEQYV